MSLARRLRRSNRSPEHDATVRSRTAASPVAVDEIAAPSVAIEAPPGQAAVTSARLDELRTQARFARERRDIYKAKVYGPRLTSPARLRELERECARTAANLSFAQAEAARQAR